MEKETKIGNESYKSTKHDIRGFKRKINICRV
jgi:hypothetical protein